MGCYILILLQEFTSQETSSAAESTTAQQCPGEKERHEEKDALIKVTHTHRSDRSSTGVLNPPSVPGVPNQDTFHIGSHILVLLFLAQASLSVRNTLSSILQNQSLNFYLNLDSAVHNTSAEKSKLC